MSQLKLTADGGGGTVAIKAPASTTGNAALDLTVPGTASGTLDTLNRAGNILQVVSTYSTTHFSSTSTSYVDTGLSATITPSSSSNKILILTNLNTGCGTTTSLYFRLYNGSSEITAATNSNASGNQGGAFVYTNAHPSGAEYDLDQVSHHYLYSPNTTSATTIKIYGRTDGDTFYLNRYDYSTSVGGASSLTLMEVAA